MKSSKPRIVIELCGGEVCGVYASSLDVSLTIVDWDELRPGELVPLARVLPLDAAPADVRAVLTAEDKQSK